MPTDGRSISSAIAPSPNGRSAARPSSATPGRRSPAGSRATPSSRWRPKTPPTPAARRYARRMHPAPIRIDLDGVPLDDEDGRTTAIFRFRTTAGLVLALPESVDVTVPFTDLAEASLDL